MRHFQVVVIGGGAAGVMAAGVAASEGKSVLMVEKMEKAQRKVRITGKGRCNLTNMRTETEFLEHVRQGADLFAPSFKAFNNQDTVSFFEKIGVPLTIERGERVFPTSSKAWDVADAHIRWAVAQGVKIECLTSVGKIITARVSNDESGRSKVTGVVLKTRAEAKEEITADSVILATGGASYPATGSTGDGYSLAYELGHTIEEIRPSLTPLETDEKIPREAVGLSLKNIAARLLINGECVGEEFGEAEFTAWGISGPIILRISRMAVDALIENRKVDLQLDLKPALSETKITNRIERELETLHPQATLKHLMAKMLPSAMIELFCSHCDISSKIPINRLTDGDKSRIVTTLKAFNLNISDYRPFEEAIVTAGGVSAQDVDPLTLESRIVEGLFFAGELLDIDADTGGYNLQIAYSTGYTAGKLGR